MRIHVEPFSDELLSAYLVRCAHVLGISPYRFIKASVPGWPAWTRDIDRICEYTRLSALATCIDVSPVRLREMTLYHVQKCLVEDPGLSPVAVTTLINTIGTRSRERQYAGLQFCPLCLLEKPTFVRSWRLSFMTICDRHICRLSDRCSRCGAQVAPFQCRLSLTRCYRCGGMLSRTVDVSVGRALQYALQAQMMLSQGLAGSVPLAGRLVSSPDFLRGCAVLLHAIKACLRTKQLTGPWGEVSGKGPRLEYLPVQCRVQLFALLGWLLESWPARCLAIASQIGLRQIHFEPCVNRPAWIVEIVEQLTPRSRPPRKRWAAALTKQVRTIESNGGASCRSERAAVLLRAVRDYHGN